MDQQNIIVKHKDKKLKVGRVCYCGMCEQRIGKLNKSLKFPFELLEFTGALNDSSIGVRVQDKIPMSIHHKTCGKDIFLDKGLIFVNPREVN